MIQEAPATKDAPKKTSQLRKECRQSFLDRGLPTGWTALASQAEMEEALETGTVPARYGSATDATPKQPAFDEAAFRATVHKVLTDIHSEVELQGKEVREKFDKKFKVVKDRVGSLVGDVIKKMDGFDLAGIERKIAEVMKATQTVTVEILVPNMPVIKAGIQHKSFPELIKVMSLGIPAYLCGPAGSGKTEAAHQAAKALGFAFHPVSVCQATSKSDLLGYYNPTGLIDDGNGNKRPVLVRTPFREAYEHGGVFLLDEIDAGNPNVTLVLNSALSNGGCSFPDGYIAKHPDFRCVAAANTWGNGADRQYVGRNQIDAATVSRFAFISWNYDEAFEVHLSGDPAWARRVQSIRKAVFDLKERVVVSPRANINGARWIKSGGSVDEAQTKFIFGGEPEERVRKILTHAGLAK